MSHGLFHAYEEILTGENLDAWRKLTPQEKQTIIDSANKKWNDRAQSEVSKKSSEVQKKPSEPRKGNESEFLKDFTNQTYGYPRVLEDPFSEVNVATKT